LLGSDPEAIASLVDRSIFNRGLTPQSRKISLKSPNENIAANDFKIYFHPAEAK